ncbi:tyrosine-type recombinase/integrase [Paraburkholderia sp. CNPSo 3281]|nr:tyrosine-type recombinase/integrase [Paraburkholderia sp. CNPSo 3281]MCP3721307.1 tyrosine-type recombinase/integrase [Paraburkholderia sp. CNPSo 3281]
MVRLFLTHMEEQRHCTVSTRNQRLGGIHALARFIGEHAPEYVDWWAQIHLIPVKRTSRPEISYLSRQEMDALLAASDVNTAQGQREHALLLFMFNSGARASEAAQLKIGDVDWHTCSVSIVGKGNRHRRCPLWKSTLDALRSESEGRAADAPVFLNRFHQTMTRSGIHALVKRCAIRAAANAPSLAGKNVHPHVIRHTTASLLLQAGVDINTIRGWLGHVSLETTNIYAEINLETKARALATCEVEGGAEGQKQWRDQPDLMTFLRTL